MMFISQCGALETPLVRLNGKSIPPALKLCLFLLLLLLLLYADTQPGMLETHLWSLI